MIRTCGEFIPLRQRRESSVTPKGSKYRQGGLIYSQFYGSVKEVTDASKCIPFENDGLEELALDPQIRQGAKQVVAGHWRDIKVLERVYCASKQRARFVLEDSRRKSFGIREEHRISWSLFQGLITKLEDDQDDQCVTLLDCPSYMWAFKTGVYLDFLWRNADKFATGFEVVRARCHKDLVTWEQTKMMAMFLRCLQFVFGAHQFSRESALWWSRRERVVGNPPQQKTWYGLGFCNTLPRYGYCWMEPRIDWNRLTFQSSVTDQMLFGNNMLRGQYLKRGGQVRDFFDTTRKLELGLEWMEKYHSLARIQTQLLSWMVHICLQQFRVDVLCSMQKEILAEYLEEALTGDQPFCWEYLTKITGSNLHLMSGNRCFQTPSKLSSFLFDFNDERKRLRWEDRPFRKLYQRARTGLSLRHGRQMGQRFFRQLLQNLFKYHWILPYPREDRWVYRIKKGKRLWYSIEKDDEGGGYAASHGWEWAKQSYQEGYPDEIPRYVSWTKEEWESWLLRNGGEVGGGGGEVGGGGGEVGGSDAEVGGSDAEVGGSDAEVGGADAEDQEMTQVTRRSSRVTAKKQRKERGGLEREGRFLGVFIPPKQVPPKQRRESSGLEVFIPHFNTEGYG